jgi:hypothetical protein
MGRGPPPVPHRPGDLPGGDSCRGSGVRRPAGCGCGRRSCNRPCPANPRAGDRDGRNHAPSAPTHPDANLVAVDASTQMVRLASQAFQGSDVRARRFEEPCPRVPTTSSSLPSPSITFPRSPRRTCSPVWPSDCEPVAVSCWVTWSCPSEPKRGDPDRSWCRPPRPLGGPARVVGVSRLCSFGRLAGRRPRRHLCRPATDLRRTHDSPRPDQHGSGGASLAPRQELVYGTGRSVNAAQPEGRSREQ